MSWSRRTCFIDLGSIQDKNKPGYCHKLCPYSTEYRDRFKYEGTLCLGIVGGQPDYQTGTFVAGNSLDRSLYGVSYASYGCSVHTTTSGRMLYADNPPGWICKDPNCYYHTTVASGKCYREA
jgi:hypothetical protein